MNASLGCWANWTSEDWRLLDRDGLVRILAETRWQERVDHQGRNVVMAGLIHDCDYKMFDQLMSHALVDHGLLPLFAHEDHLGARFPAYALRHANRMQTASSSVWKDAVFSGRGWFLNSQGVGLCGQLEKLAAQSLHPHAWFPVEEALPVHDQKVPASGIASITDWMAGLSELQIDAYVANRLLVHIAGRPRSHAPDVEALETWVLPIYHADLASGHLEQWTPSSLRMMRLVDVLVQMMRSLTLGPHPPATGQALLLSLFESIRTDLVALAPLCQHPDRHVVKWVMEEQRVSAHWEALLLSVETPPAASQGDPRRL